MLTKRDPNASGDTEACSQPKKTFCTQEEQRQATRFRREENTDFAAIWRESGEEILVEVHDESLTGLGIIVDDDTLDLKLGSHVQVVYAGEYLQGEVRHITMQPHGKKLIGLRCERLEPNDDK